MECRESNKVEALLVCKIFVLLCTRTFYKIFDKASPTLFLVARTVGRNISVGQPTMVNQKCLSSRYFQKMDVSLLILFTFKGYTRINTFTEGKVNVVAIIQKLGSAGPVQQ